MIGTVGRTVADYKRIMTLIKTLIPVAMVAALAVTAAPAQAQWGEHGGGWHRGKVSRGFAVTRGHVSIFPTMVSRVGPRVHSQRVLVVPRTSLPDLSFRPRIRVGSGVWGGYPFTYPFVFGYPFPYAPDPLGIGTLESAQPQR
jgi:hypothetical protein